MAFPDEIVAGPVVVYAAPLATVKPDVSQTPGGAWIKLGAQGDKNITEDGVHIFHEDSKSWIRMLGATAPIKAFPESEDLRVEFMLADLNAEMISIMMGGPATTASSVVTVAAGVSIAAQKTLALYKGLGAKLAVSLLIRALQSPANPAFAMQWWIPKCVADGQLELIWNKTDPVALAGRFVALWDPTNGIGAVEVQTGLPS